MANPELFWELHDVYPMETKDSTFYLETHGQQNVAGAIFVDHSNRPFLFMIATQVLCVMPDSDLDP